MKLSGNTILITGGASGIGLAFAERFLKAGSKVIVCGRREGKLQEALKMGVVAMNLQHTHRNTLRIL